MNIERQIGFKAIGIYIFIILMIALALLYGNKLKQQIHRLQESITIQQDALVLTHELVSETAHLLLQTAPYLNTQDILTHRIQCSLITLSRKYTELMS